MAYCHHQLTNRDHGVLTKCARVRKVKVATSQMHALHPSKKNSWMRSERIKRRKLNTTEA